MLLALLPAVLAQAPEVEEQAALPAEDAALLEALLALLSEDGGVPGAQALGLLADPRSRWVLSHSVRYREPAVAAAAAQALGAFPEAAPDLAGWVCTPTLADAVRVAAARALARQGDAAGADAIVRAMGEADTSDPLRADLGAVLAERWPDRVAETLTQVRRDGTPLLMAGTAAGLGFALAATGHFGQSGLESLGALTGAAGGATLGFVWGRARPVSAGPAALYTAAGVGGMFAGAALGAWAEPVDGPWVGGLVGGAAGYGAGLAAWRRWPGTAGDALLGSAVGGAGATLFQGATTMAQAGGLAADPAARLGMAGLGLGLGTGVGMLTAPGMDLDERDAVLAGGAVITGAFLGAAMPLGVHPRDGLVTVTTSGAALLAYGLGPVARVPPDVTSGAVAGLTFGAVGGAGIGMLARPGGDEDRVRTATTVGGLAGEALGGWLAHRAPGGISPGDTTLTTLATGWATWQTLGWAQVTDPDPALEGLLLLAPATAGAAVAVTTPWTEVELGDSLAATSLGLWGAYLGATSGLLADTDDDLTLALALGASDLGLATGALLVSPVVDADPVVVGTADAGGVLLGATGALVTALFTRESDPIVVASMVGAGVGATGGGLLGRYLVRRPPRPPGVALGAARWPDGLALAPACLPAPQGGPAWGLHATLAGW